ncbi:hypothetical protein QA635_18660 [Bradyrhizobium brasilense]|uniref:hypothetical protein n=1 Tax=Bradyrhizobium brasilense TaxID=1419277 RepID=UPI0024B2394A|nr:hypothetical protein [Bradyrhizobium australafricanum]WFU36319.1 hypothetical protein QA635_18660 [Bradyrhizobium australafricanum]
MARDQRIADRQSRQRRRNQIAAIIGTEAIGSAAGASSAAADGAATSEAVGSAGNIRGEGDPRSSAVGVGQAGAMMVGFSREPDRGFAESFGFAGGNSSAAAQGVATITVRVGTPDAVDALWENVRAQRALMQVVLQSRPVGPGHNQGPEFAPTAAQDMLEADRLVALLSEEGPRNQAGAREILEAARSAANRAERGKTAMSAFALGVLAGAGQFVGNKGLEALAGTPWFKAFYAQLADLAAAAIAWVQAIL